MSSPSRLSPAQVEEAVGRAASGETITAIAKSYGVSRQAIRGHLRRRGVPPRIVAKLAEPQRAAAARLYVEGASLPEVAGAFGLTEPGMRGLLLSRGVAIRRTVRTLRHDAFEVLTPQACYWLGFLFADGCVSYRPGHLPQISVGLAARDREHLDSLRSFLGSSSRISAPSRTHRSCQFSVRSQQLAKRLIMLGRYEGTVDERLTGSRDFWRGVVDGDGSLGIYRRSKTRTSSFPQFRLVGSRRLLESFVEFLQDNGIHGLSVRPHKAIYAVGTTCRPAVRIVGLLYADAIPALPRKAVIARSISDLWRQSAGLERAGVSDAVSPVHPAGCSAVQLVEEALALLRR